MIIHLAEITFIVLRLLNGLTINFSINYVPHILYFLDHYNNNYYPEHVLTWEGYGNRRVRSFVCLSVTFNS